MTNIQMFENLLRELDTLDKKDESESPRADYLRCEMEILWPSLGRDEQTEMHNLSAELNMCLMLDSSTAPNKRDGRIPADIYETPGVPDPEGRVREIVEEDRAQGW